METIFRNTILLAAVCLIPILSGAQTQELKVGESYTCRIYDYWNTTDRHKDVEWHYRSDLFSAEIYGYSAKFTVKQYFTGTTEIECTYKEAENIYSTWWPKSHTWYFRCKEVAVNSVSIESFISVNADQSTTVYYSLSPSGGTVNDLTWTVADPTIAKVSGNNTLTGLWPGTTTMYCTVNGNIRSNTAKVTVMEPSFTFSGFSVEDGASNVDTKPTITATYSHTLSKGDRFDQIALTDAQGKKVEGTASISGTTIAFTPSKYLQPLTSYTLTIPDGAVKNKWGTAFASTRSVRFTSADWKRMTLTVQPEAKYITRGDKITLTCSAPEATIYYSTDGDTPSMRYTGPLTFEEDMTLLATAELDGYHNAEMLEKQYMQRIEIAERFPDAEPLYVYADVIPSMMFTQDFNGNLSLIELQREDMQTGTVVNMDFETILHDRTLYFVTKEPLETGMSYVVTIPEGALTSRKGEPIAAISWRFTTGSYATAISVGGPELEAALMTGGSLWTWGRRLTTANAEDGSYSYTVHDAPAEFVSRDVVAVSSGFMHHALLKNDGSLWMWGRQLCGEFGNGSTTASAQPVKVMEDVASVNCGLQTTAIVKTDGTLWMCGRNDLCQIDSTREAHHAYVKVIDGVKEATLGLGFISIVLTDGTTTTRTWDETIDAQRSPLLTTIDGMTSMQYGWQNAMALSPDGSVWTWGATDEEPIEMITGRKSQPLEGVTLLTDRLMLDKDGKAVIPTRPLPLQADYEQMNCLSSNVSVAEVSDRGVVTAHGEGQAVVTIAMTDRQGRNVEAQCTVLVEAMQGIHDVMQGDYWQLRVTANGRQLRITGVPVGQTVSVYNAAGAIVYQGCMTSDVLHVPVCLQGIYIVRANRQVQKCVSR